MFRDMGMDRPARGGRQQLEGASNTGTSTSVNTASMSGGLDYNAPLRGAGSAPSPFYKLSTELSRESLRTPGAIPFQWEQTPGRRKSGAATTGALPAAPVSVSAPVPAPPHHHDPPPAKPSLAALFRQGSLRYSVPAPPGDPRSASARFLPSHGTSVGPPLLPPPRPRAPRDDASDDGFASEVAFTAVSASSDVLTAAAGLSVDGSLAAVSGPPPPQAPAPDDRHLIMHRFLPAAHAIACDSPQTPSRRHTVGHNPATEAAAAARQLLVRPSPLRYSSTNSAAATPSRVTKLHRPPDSPLADDGDDEDDDECADGHHPPPAAAMKGCGMFSFRFRAAFIHLCSRASPTSTTPSSLSSYSRSKKKPTSNKKKSSGAPDPAAASSIVNQPPRLADILKESDDSLADWMTSIDDASSYTDASSRFSPMAHPYGSSDNYRGSTLTGAMSPFIEGKGFLGMPNDHHRHRLNAQSDRYATPRSSTSAGEALYNRAEEIVSDNGRSQFQKETVTNMNDQPLNLQHSIIRVDHADCDHSKGDDDQIRIRGRHKFTATVPIPVITERAVESNDQYGGPKMIINGSVNMMLSPPLPKSPSESWLWKAMASPAKAGFSPQYSKRMELGSPINRYPPRHHGPKWENIVKGSHVQPGHLRFSEELLHQSKNSIKVGGI